MPVVGEVGIQDVVIANGAAVSGAIKVAGYRQGSVQFPAAITNTSFTCEVTNEDTPTNWTALQDDAGTAIALVPATANESCPLPANVFKYRHCRVKMNGNEGAARTVRVVLNG